jgi:ribosomal protein S10
MYTLRISFQSVQKIDKLKINQFKNIKINNFFNIKKKKKIFTLLKSPHVNKKSREHFIYENYSKKVDLDFNNIFQLINFIILLKKKLSNKFLIKTKIIKKSICL